MSRERVHRFGSHGGLMGVVSEPASGAVAEAPGVLFANVGLNHHVGPNRVWVDLARRLAASGFTSLRFDLSGLGDSEPRGDARPDGERAVLDLTEAMDFLASRTGSSRFVLVANCSGVDALHATALGDPRVAGAVAIDGYAYRNSGYWLRRRTVALLQPSRWERRWRKYRFERAGARREAGEAREVWTRDIPTREVFASDLDRLRARGAELLLVYSGGMDQAYNYRGQFEAVFGRRDGVEVDFYPQADHLFSAGSDRRWLLSRIDRWMTSRFATARG